MVCNGMLPQRFSAADAAQRSTRRPTDPRSAPRATPTRGPAPSALQLRRLRRRARAAVTTLPHVFDEDDRLATLARELEGAL